MQAERNASGNFFQNLPTPMKNESTRKLLDALESEGFRPQMEGSYGKRFEEAVRLGSGEGTGKFARVAFEESKDKRINRAGWTLSNVNWLLEHPEEVEAVMKLGEDIRRRFKNVVFCGMGGSGLSVQVVKTTFGEKGARLFSLRTTDRAVIAGIQDEIATAGGMQKGLGKEEALSEGLKDTLVVAISKSGTTPETISHKDFFEELFRKAGLNPADHLRVMTDPGSPMEREAAVKGYALDYIQLNKGTDIGGRFASPTTGIFLLPLALTETSTNDATAKAMDILRQAKEMNDAKQIEDDRFVNLGAFLYKMAREGKDKLTLIVPDEFRDIPMWAEQLFEESLGKGGRGVTVFYGEKLTFDTLKDAEENDRVFVRINTGKKKTQEKLWNHVSGKGYPTFEINARNVNSAGGIMLGFQRTVATVGYLWGIGFVDQPAVEGYKNATRDEMAQIDAAGGGKVQVPQEWSEDSVPFGKLKLYYHPLIAAGGASREEIEQEVRSMGEDAADAPAVYAAIIQVLSKKPGFEAAEIASYGRMTKRLRRVMEDARYEIYTKGLRMPSKLSEGPDKNHSYQQNIEDGRNIFLSTYLTYLNVPKTTGADYDENLLRAITVGTVKSMIANKRKAVLITAGSDARGAESDVERFFREVEGCLK